MTDETDPLRDALRRYAAPAATPPGGTRRVLDRLSRRRRRRAVVAVAGATAVLLLGGGLLVDDLGPGDADRKPPPADRTHGLPGRWVEMAPAPLAQRHESVGVWTGSEMLVAGGATGCLHWSFVGCENLPETYVGDGAAYDPESDSWRRIADAPAALRSANAVWSGSEMVVTARAGTFAYDPEQDAWRTWEPRPRVSPYTYEGDSLLPPVVTPAGIVYASPHQPEGSTSADLLLDPASGTWSRLPRDPFGETFARSVAWDGERLWSLSMSVENYRANGTPDAGASMRLAVLEGGITDGTWRVAEWSTPNMTVNASLWWTANGLLVSPAFEGSAIFYSPDTGWSEVEGPPAVCDPVPVDAGDRWISLSGPTIASDEPSCPLLRDPDVALWAGDDLLMWGGPDNRGSRGTAVGYRSGGPLDGRTPVDPCPDWLESHSGRTSGFGPTEPAPAAPSLPEPQEAWVCGYSPDEPPYGDSGYDWQLDVAPQPLDDDAVALLGDYLDRLTPPPHGRECPADALAETRPRRVAGLRYLVSYRAGDDRDLTGVVVDDFGCQHLRLTDDPFVVEPGRSTADGVVPGVLEAPAGFVDRLRAALS